MQWKERGRKDSKEDGCKKQTGKTMARFFIDDQLPSSTKKTIKSDTSGVRENWQWWEMNDSSENKAIQNGTDQGGENG